MLFSKVIWSVASNPLKTFATEFSWINNSLSATNPSFASDKRTPVPSSKSRASVKLIDKYGIDGDFIESQAFGYLAIRSYLNKFITFPSTTGVKKSCLGGSVFKI